MVENTFGILASRSSSILTIMAQDPHNVMLVVCVTLHNIMRTRYREGLADENNKHMRVQGGWRQG